MSEGYYDAGEGRWRDEEGHLLDERPEDDEPADLPEDDEPGGGSDGLTDRQRDKRAHRRRKRRPREREDVAADPEDFVDPEDDPEFRRARGEFAELSGMVKTGGRKRGPNPAGFGGSRIRGLRYKEEASVKKTVLPSGRRLGTRAPQTGKPAYGDLEKTIRKALGPERVGRLHAAMAKGKGGRPTTAEVRDRDYAAIVLELLNKHGSVRASNGAMARVLDVDPKRVRDLKGRAITDESRQATLAELMERYRRYARKR